ncbi:glycosyltransferase family 4 protein [bacterium]|nr:glycosyltransferase family 4 protein [bacterium]
MKIAQVAPIWTSVPPKKYGGTERIVHFLTEELVRRGHQVTLFASGDSKTKARLVSVWPRALIKEKLYGKPIPWSNCVFPLLNLARAFKEADKFDILHFHENSVCLSNFFISLIKTPALITLHDPAPDNQAKDRKAAFMTYKNHNYVSLSLSHQQLWKKFANLHFVANVYNGIDLEPLKFKKKKKDYLVWLGRSSKNKGAKEAIQVAKKVKKKLILAGRIDKNSPTSLRYFEEEIKPRLGGNIKYIGEVGKKEKSKILGEAQALLFPILWEEPFGLVVIEAMACGTPVIAFDRGSMKELIKDGKTGFLVKNIDEMAEAIKKIDLIKPQDCRKWVEEKFSIKRMTNDYEKVYKKILATKNK